MGGSLAYLSHDIMDNAVKRALEDVHDEDDGGEVGVDELRKWFVEDPELAGLLHMRTVLNRCQQSNSMQSAKEFVSSAPKTCDNDCERKSKLDQKTTSNEISDPITPSATSESDLDSDIESI